MYQFITFVSTIFIVLIILFIFRKKSNASFSKFLKIITILYCCVGFFRLLLADSFVYVINGGNLNGSLHNYIESKDVLQTILRWGYYISYVVIPMAVFFENRLFRNIMSYVCLPFAILTVIYFNDFMEYFLQPTNEGYIGAGLKLLPWARYLIFILELVLAMSIEVVLQIKYKHFFNFKNKKECIYFFGLLPLILLQLMPVYTIQSLIGYQDYRFTIGQIQIPWIIITILEIIVLHYVFRFKSYQDRYQLIVFLTIALFYHYDSLYLMGFAIRRLPIQLCNLASYIYMIALLFKRQRLFDFCYIVNIVGTLIAILAPDLPASNGTFGFWTIHYMFEHMLVLIIPVLCMSLRIFKRMDKKSLKHALIGFAIYFVFCFTSGLILNAFVIKNEMKVNYFFIFDLEKACDYVPFIRVVENYAITINGFSIYPILIAIIIVIFVILCLVWYWLIQKIYVMSDDHFELRKSRIDLVEKITGKKSNAKREYED